MLKYLCMKRFILLIFTLFLSMNDVFALVEHVDLDSMIQIGLEKNRTIKIKKIELGMAEKDIKIANRLQNPQLQSNVVMGNVALGNCSQAGLNFPIEILKRGLRKKVAKHNYSLKETELKQFEHNFKLQIMQAYFDVLFAKSDCLIQQKRLELFESLVDITTQRERHVSYEIDNLKADIQYATQKIKVNRAHSNLLAKQFELNKILNLDDTNLMYDTKESSLLKEDWKFLNLEIPNYDYIEKAALKYSYIIRLSEKNIEKSKSELELVKNKRIPDIDLAGGYAWQYHRNANPHYGGAYVGFGMNIPILYNFTPDIQKATLFLQKNKANKEVYEHQLKYELKKDYNIYKYSAENIILSKQILADSERIVNLSTKHYIEGKNTYTDLIMNINAHQEILTQYLNIMSRHFYSYLELLQDIGHDIFTNEEIL